jgi:acyl-CoA synthetase (NDP forming)
LAASILDRAQERGIGFSYVITTGNQADIHNVECIEYMVDDSSTQVIALFAEAIGHTSRFRAAVMRAARAGKPCVVLKTGASEVARESALAHTGSMVGDDDVYAAAFRQNGVVRVQDPDELFLTSALLSSDLASVNRTDTARIAVVSMSGAMGGILADGAARNGVTMAPLSARTKDSLLAISGICIAVRCKNRPFVAGSGMQPLRNIPICHSFYPLTYTITQICNQPVIGTRLRNHPYSIGILQIKQTGI